MTDDFSSDGADSADGTDTWPTRSAPQLPTPPIRLIRLDEGLPLPVRAHAGDAGVDLHITADITIEPGERAVVGTGIAIALPLGTVGLVHPRSGLAARSGLSIVNAPGTIDAGYRGEIKVCLINLDPRAPIDLVRGDRIAQLLVQRVELVTFDEVDTLDDTARGAGGYGSSGGHASLTAASSTGNAASREKVK